jgi:hypothetical protein
LAPLVTLIRAPVMAAGRIHGDDTTGPVLAKGGAAPPGSGEAARIVGRGCGGKTVTGRLWSYVRDDRPFAGPAPPAAIFHASRDRGGEHPKTHLAGYRGSLQADAYAGFNEHSAPSRQPEPLAAAACWARLPKVPCA